MKLNPTRAASLLAIMAALALNACAAPDILADPEPQKIMKPHSHLEEKIGFALKASDATPDKPNPANDRT